MSHYECFLQNLGSFNLLGLKMFQGQWIKILSSVRLNCYNSREFQLSGITDEVCSVCTVPL